MTEWFETLPDKCPPSDSFTVSGQKYYRLTKDKIPTNDDFTSMRIEFPQREFIDRPECIVCAVSVFADKFDCDNLLKLPRHRGKSVFELNLQTTDGVIKQTFKPSHHSWWRSISFDFNSLIL